MQVLLALITYFLVNITWVFFRAGDFATAWRMIVTMLTFVTSGDRVLPTIFILETVITITVMLVVHWYMRNRRINEVIGRLPTWITGLLWGAMLTLIVITQGGSDAFIYFQFQELIDMSKLDRPLPGKSLGTAALIGIVFGAALIGGWEYYWRDYGALAPYYRNSEGLWAIERRRIDRGEGGRTVLAGSSRMLFGLRSGSPTEPRRQARKMAKYFLMYSRAIDQDATGTRTANGRTENRLYRTGQRRCQPRGQPAA